MRLDEFKAAVAAKANDIVSGKIPDAELDACLPETVGRAASLFRRDGVPPTAVDPSFWLTIIQFVLPLILAWFNRRFPPVPAPVPAPVPVPVVPVTE